MISPAIIAAAARVLPAPKTPLIGHSVLPSSNDNKRAGRVARKWLSLLYTNGMNALLSCPSSSVISIGSSISMSRISRSVGAFLGSVVAVG